MRYPGPLIPATFINRPNRFVAAVDVDGIQAMAHLANSGRLRELLEPRRPVYLTPRSGPKRKTSYDLQLVRLPQGLVSADARLPNGLVAEAIEEGKLPPFAGYTGVRREVTHGDSRLDLVLTRESERCLIEVKSVTLVVEGRGLFPDAPTERGRKHVLTLAEAARQGERAAVVFVIQRAAVRDFGPNDSQDPEFGAALRAAHAAGVEIYAYRCRVSLKEIVVTGPLPVVL